MPRVGIAGVGQLPFKTRYADKNYQELAFEATEAALMDAKLSIRQMDGAIYAIYSDLLMRQQTPETMVHEYIGMMGKPALRITAGASTGTYALRAAYAEVAAGLAESILLLGIQKSGDLINPETGHRGEGTMMSESITHDVNWQHPYTPFPPAAWGVILTAHMHRWGTPTLEQMARVSVKNHRNAFKNPNAQLRLDVDVQEVLNSRLIAWPTTMYEACLFSEGAAAVVVVSEDFAARNGLKPVWISGVGTSHDASSPRIEPELLGRMPAISQAAEQAYRMAGITDPRNELDVIELHDLFAGLEVLTYEELNLCAPGRGGDLIDQGVVEMDGELPVNPSGGRLACGHIAGPSEVYSIGEIVLQLRGEAGERQVAIRHGRGLVATVGGQCASLGAVIVLENDRA